MAAAALCAWGLAACSGKSAPPRSGAQQDAAAPGPDAGAMDAAAPSDASPSDAAQSSDAMQAGADAGDASAPPQDAGELPIQGAALAVSPQALDMGSVECGVTPDPFTVQIANALDDPTSYQATLSGADAAQFEIVSGASASLDIGAATKLLIALRATSSALAAGTALHGSLDLVSPNKGADPVHVPLTAVLHGGTISLSPAALAFGDQPVNGVPAALPVTLTNSGDRSLQVTFGSPGDAQYTLLDAPSGANGLEPGAQLTVHVQFAPTRGGAADSGITLTVDGGGCGMSAQSIPLSGTGALGVAELSGDLDFGLVPCGTQANPKTLTVGNSGDASFKFTAALGRGDVSPFQLDTDYGEVAAQGAPVQIAVQPKLVPPDSAVPGDYSDTLTITTNVPGDSPHMITVQEAAQGAVLSFDTSQLMFGSVTSGTSSDLGFHVINSGNLSAHVSLALGPGSSSDFSVTPPGPSVLALTPSLDATATFSPHSAASRTATIVLSVDPSDVVCRLPDPLQLSGMGQ